jgi:hypothetical protein
VKEGGSKSTAGQALEISVCKQGSPSIGSTSGVNSEQPTDSQNNKRAEAMRLAVHRRFGISRYSIVIDPALAEQPVATCSSAAV